MKCKENWLKIISLVAILWIVYVFLGSIPYKFSGHPETKYIFDTIWEWMKWTLWEWIWTHFINYWAYEVGSMEIIVSIILLIPVFGYIWKLFWLFKEKILPEFLLGVGWIWATMIMTWAIFFHLFTPLWTEVNGDGWSLFRAAVSIWVLWIVLFIIHFSKLKDKVNKCLKN